MIEKKMIKNFKEFSDKLPEDLKKGFDDFLTNYLFKFYLNPDSKFNFSVWNYYDQIVTNNTFDISTNVIESINAKLNNAAGKGNLPFHKAIYVLVQFKTDYIITFVSANVNNALNLIRPATLHRKNTIREQVQLFCPFPAFRANKTCSFFRRRTP